MEPRFSLNRDQINLVVANFYAKVRADKVLGPVFAAHVTDWRAHEIKIGNFWSNAILRTHSYDGNPMQAHIAAGNVKSEYFVTWLALFDEVLAQELPREAALVWSHLAHRIGRGLSSGLDFHCEHSSGAPRLRP